MDSIFYFNSNSDFDSDHEPNVLGDLAIPILIPNHSDSHSYFYFGYEPNIPLIESSSSKVKEILI